MATGLHEQGGPYQQRREWRRGLLGIFSGRSAAKPVPRHRYTCKLSTWQPLAQYLATTGAGAPQLNL